MKKSTRVLILVGVVELMLIGGGFWLASQFASGAMGYDGPNAEAAARTLESAGMAAVPLAIMFGILALSLRKKGE